MSCAPGGYDTSIMRPSLPGASARSIANRSFTSAASAGTAARIRSAAREAQQHTGSFFMVFLSGASSGHALAASPCHPTVPSAWRAGSGSCLCAAEPCVEPDAAEARVAQRYERALLDPAAEVAGVGVTHLTFRTPSDGDPPIFPAACFARTAHPNRDMLLSHARRYIKRLRLWSMVWVSCYRPS